MVFAVDVGDRRCRCGMISRSTSVDNVVGLVSCVFVVVVITVEFEFVAKSDVIDEV